MSDKIFLLHETKKEDEKDKKKECNHQDCWHTKLNKVDIKDYIQLNKIKTKQDELESISTPFMGLEKHKQYYVDNNSLSDVECDKFIEKFENDLRKMKGITESNAVNLQVKDTLDLHITGFIDWLELDRLLYNKLKLAIEEFKKQTDRSIYDLNPLFTSRMMTTDGFQIQKYEKGMGKYIWHTDGIIKYKETLSGQIIPFTRIYTYIWYLNDIEEGGETMFLHDKIKPKKGKLLLFPSTWDNIHCGNYSQNENKYIITGCISCNAINDIKIV